MAAGDLDACERSLSDRRSTLEPTLQVAETNLRLSLALQGRYEEALSGVETERLPIVLNDVGYAAIQRGDYDHARLLLVRAIEASPSFFETGWANLRHLDALEKQRLRERQVPL